MKSKVLGFALALASLAGAAPALAQEQAATAGKIGVGALLGYGFKDGVDFGLGVRGGYTLPMNVYLGGTFMYHFGKSEGPASVNVYYFGAEGGYDIQAGPVVVRPYLGLGPAFAHGSVGNLSNTDTKFGVWPGATVLYPIENFYVGGDARVLIVSDFTAFSLFATGGVHF